MNPRALTQRRELRSLPAVTDRFQEHRSLLFGIAYRMLGSVAEAEDMVQETYLRWQRQDVASIDVPRAWLIKTITRLCVDQLRSARRQRDEYYGVWLPEPLVQETAATPDASAALSDSLSMAFLMMLETLAPHERAVFLLREAFDYDYSEIATIVGKSEANCRQIVSRAKGSLKTGERRYAPPQEKAEAVMHQFLAACATGDVGGVLSTLTDDVTLFSDGGGRVRAAGRPIHSADHVSRFFLGVRNRGLKHAEFRPVVVNARPGVLIVIDRRVDSVVSFEIVENRIREIYLVRNPEKLRHVHKARVLSDLN